MKNTNQETAYCELCNEMVDYFIKNVVVKDIVNEKCIQFDKKEVHCSKCDNVLHVLDIHNENMDQYTKELNK